MTMGMGYTTSRVGVMSKGPTIFVHKEAPTPCKDCGCRVVFHYECSGLLECAECFGERGDLRVVHEAEKRE